MTRRRFDLSGLMLALLVLVASPVHGTTIEFRGMVDLLSDQNTSQAKVWVVAPNLASPQDLPLPPKCEVHSVHDPMILVDESVLQVFTLDGSAECPLTKHTNLRSCTDGVIYTGVSIKGCEVTLDGSGGGVTSHRVKRTGTKPPTIYNESSLNWLFDIDSLLPGSDLREGIDDDDPKTDSGYSVLASRLVIDRGTISAGQAWLYNGKIAEIDLHKTDGSSAPGRAASRTVNLEIPGDQVILKLCELRKPSCDDPARVTLKAKTGKELIFRVVNEAFGPKMHCDTHAGDLHRHFFGHFALRKNSKSLADCTWPDDLTMGSGNNPLCSPGDNKGP